MRQRVMTAAGLQSAGSPQHYAGIAQAVGISAVLTAITNLTLTRSARLAWQSANAGGPAA